VSWGPDERRGAVTVSFDNLGEVTDLQRGNWPEGEQLGRHFSVTRALPRVLKLLEELDLRATFFVEGLNTELYPDTLRGIAAAGHEVAYHGWCHEPWSELDPQRELELLRRGVEAMSDLDLRPHGFRPPGGDLTSASLSALREIGFLYCSPAGEGVKVRDGIAILPFDWQALDAYYYLPRFAPIRERGHGSPEALPPSRLAETLEAAIGRDGHLSLVFHPFLTEPEERFEVMQGALAAVKRADVWCAPYREVSEWVRSH
jgi:peptidoglycan/xylan/chitin deacetylase (PgdA/CDA1 family)